ncbi:MAG: alkaline phosphatase D family protein [Phycisphaerales bacterium]
MRFRPSLASALAASLLVSTLAAEPVIDTIAFGSCARERREQPIWDEIIKTDPDLFLFIGDNQYADFWEKDGKMVMQRVPGIERIDEAYAALAAKPGFQRMKAHCPMLATWDDHDYGDNDSGKDFPFRAQSQKAFLDFFGFASDDPIRRQEGIYHARTFGPADKRVQVILLDTRYHRDLLEKGTPGAAAPGTSPRGARGGGPYVPTTNTSKTVLGETQWRWLEARLHEPAHVRIIVSSIQVVADEHGHETWGNFPHERQRLYDLIASTGASGVVFISGDRHLAEVSVDRGRGSAHPVPYPMWDFTSSGMTEPPGKASDPNSFRVGPVSRETNFGVIEIRWGDHPPETTEISFTARGDKSQMITRQSVFLTDLHK